MGIYDGNGDRNRSPATYFNNGGYGNLIGWVNGSGRNDWWMPHTSTWTNNTHWSGTITLSLQANEMNVWKSKLTSNSIKVGRV